MWRGGEVMWRGGYVEGRVCRMWLVRVYEGEGM